MNKSNLPKEQRTTIRADVQDYDTGVILFSRVHVFSVIARGAQCVVANGRITSRANQMVWVTLLRACCHFRLVRWLRERFAGSSPAPATGTFELKPAAET